MKDQCVGESICSASFSSQKSKPISHQLETTEDFKPKNKRQLKQAMKAEIPNEAGTMITKDKMINYFTSIKTRAREQLNPGPSLLLTPQSQNIKDQT